MRILLPLLLLNVRLFAGNSVDMTMIYQDSLRSFIVYLPSGYNPGAHLPVVFNLHGLGSNGGQQVYYSKMYIAADSNNFIMVAPDGLDNSWNSGFQLPYNSNPDDVGFISKIIDTLSMLYQIDLTRVYSCGMSNGGYQSHRLACDLEERIAAIASVTGSITDITVLNCATSRKVPVLQIHGTDDPLVPYAGSSGSYAIEDVIGFWCAKNQCSTVNDTIFVADIDNTDSSTVQKIHWRTCGYGSEVWFYKIIGGGHTWPNAAIPYIYGPTNKDIDASQEIWDFFKKFSLPNASAVLNEEENIALSVYPNPANNYLQIECERMIQSVQVFNSLGEKLKNIEANTTQVAVSIADCAPGFYFIKTEGRGYAEMRRVVKQ